MEGINKLTDTTGTVNGIEHVQAFIRMAYEKFDSVRVETLAHARVDFLQYTLLTFNRIVIYV